MSTLTPQCLCFPVNMLLRYFRSLQPQQCCSFNQFKIHLLFCHFFLKSYTRKVSNTFSTKILYAVLLSLSIYSLYYEHTQFRILAKLVTIMTGFSWFLPLTTEQNI